MMKYYYKMKLVDKEGRITITKDDLMLDVVTIEGSNVVSSKKLTRVGDEKISLLDTLVDAKKNRKSFGIQLCNNPKCTICQEVCPVDAITFHKDEHDRIMPDINYEICIRCGLCIDNCPMKVFERG